MEVTLPKPMPLDKPLPKELLLLIKNLLMNKLNEKLKKYCHLTIDPYWLLILEDVSLRSSEDQVPELENKNLTDENILNLINFQ